MAGNAASAFIAVAGGVSGATNAVLYAQDKNGLSSYQESQVYGRMQKDISDAMNSYSEKTGLNEKSAAVTKLKATCLFYPLPNSQQPVEQKDSATQAKTSGK